MALIGIMSDSHGDAHRTQQAVDLLISRAADHLLHLGDICDDSVLDSLATPLMTQSPTAPTIRLVYGNCDWPSASTTAYAQKLGLMVCHPVGQLTIDDKRLIFLHGDDPRAMSQAIEQKPAYLLHGHTHQQRDELIGQTRVINPGALHRASTFTVALLDTTTESLAYFEID